MRHRVQRVASRSGLGPLVCAGFAAGVVAGALVWRRQQNAAHDQLFSPSAVQRAAALGWIARTPSVENARLLRDYILWERRPTLRRRADRALASLLLALES